MLQNIVPILYHKLTLLLKKKKNCNFFFRTNFKLKIQPNNSNKITVQICSVDKCYNVMRNSFLATSFIKYNSK